MIIPAQFADEPQKSVFTACYKAAVANRTELEASYLATLAAMSYGDKAMQGYKVPQEVANYQPYGALAGQGCATCWWFNSPDYCRVVEGSISPTGKSDFYLEVQAVTAELPTAQKEIREQPFLQKILQKFKKEKKEYGFKTLSEYGRPDLWIAWYTNPYQDRDGEFFTEASIAADVKRMNETGKFPELWWRHLPGSKHGQAIGVWKIERFAVAVGTFDDTPKGRAAQKFYASTKRKIGVSHGYYYYAHQKQGDTYTGHATFEISPLFYEIAANAYAGLAVDLGEKSMPMSADERAAIAAELLEVFREPAIAEEIISMTTKRSAQLDAAGIAHKAKKTPPPPPDEEDEEEDEEKEPMPPKKKSVEGSTAPAWFEQMLELQKQTLEAIKSMGQPATPAPQATRTAGASGYTTEAEGDVVVNQRLKRLINAAKESAEPEAPTYSPEQFIAQKMFSVFGGPSDDQ